MFKKTATPAQPPGSSPRWRLSRQARNNLRAYAFVSPWLFSLLAFTAYPTLASFYYAMTQYTIVNPPEWVGFENFVAMFTRDPLFRKAVWNTVYYTFISVPLGLLVALLLAILLNHGTRGISFYRTIFYLPSLMPIVATTLLFMLLLDPRAGLVNTGLKFLGLPQPGWLFSAEWSKPGLIMMSLWIGSGPPMLIFLAGLKEVPKSLLEAATIDGANPWQRYWYVVLPLLTPTIYFNLIIGLITAFQVFANAFVAISLRDSAGPLDSLMMYMVYLYRHAFRYFSMGYASALAVVLFIVLVLLTLLVVRTASSWVYYEGGSSNEPQGVG